MRPDSTGGPEDVPVRASTVACRRQSRRLGEATHGTRECFEHQDRLIRSLVTECGVRTVAFEVDAAAATVLDAFVRDGSALSTAPADAAAALAELDMWQWRTESVRDLLEWLEAFNTGGALSAQVRIAPSVDHA